MIMADRTIRRWGDKPYHSLDYEMKRRFGEKVYKISLTGGTTCPNRDGTLDHRGCIFCSERGSGDFASPRYGSVTEQINQEISRLQKQKRTGNKFIAYFQSFTGTYAPVSLLRQMYEEAMAHPDVVLLSVATRPDCLPDDILHLLAECRKKMPVMIELGLQTIHADTVSYIRRCYPTEVYDRAVARLTSIGIEVVTHVIAGLPGETKEDFLKTVSHTVCQKSDGIKLQLLHVLQGTDLAKEYAQHTFDVLSLDDYLDYITAALCILPPEMVIHRVTGDGPRDLLAAPLWSLDKRHVLNALHQKMKREHIWQGMSCQ